MELQLEGKRAVVTGGSRGIGKAIAMALAQEAAASLSAHANLPALQEAAGEIAAATGRKVVPLTLTYVECSSRRTASASAAWWRLRTSPE